MGETHENSKPKNKWYPYWEEGPVDPALSVHVRHIE